MLASLRASGVARSLLGTATRGYAAASKDTWTLQIEAEHKTHLCDGPGTLEVKTTKQEMLDHYNTMFTMRRMEVLCDQLYKQRAIRGFLHLYNGQEAVATGVGAAIRPEDHLLTAYRDHCWALVRGASVESIIAECLGKRTGISGGMGGSMHMYSDTGRFYGGNAIVGAQIPMGAGIAFAQKYLGTDQVCITAYGDGAANQGQLFETFNMAYLWKLPVIFLVENNHYGMGTSVTRSSGSPDFYTRGDFVPGMKVNGMDVLGVKQATEYAANFARENGPIIMEMLTYRYYGHSMSDPGTTYRTRTEVDSVRTKQDPITKLKERILKQGVPPEELKAIEKAAKQQCDAANEAAQSADYPDPEMLWRNVYAEPTLGRPVERDPSLLV